MEAWQDKRLWEEAREVAASLAQRHLRLVLAESCTGGLAAAALTTIAGISQWFCGSAVTYRDQTKVDWLQVRTDDLEQVSAVSSQVAMQMAQGALAATREADVAVAITGHLGPGAPPELDGLIWIGTAQRQVPPTQVRAEPFRLSAGERSARQVEAATRLLRQAAAMVRAT